MFDKDKFLQNLTTTYCGRELLYYKTLPSTNDTAKAYAKEGAGRGLVVMAEGQSAGRGRDSKSFYSPEGAGLYFTVVLKPELKPQESVYITYAAALSVVYAIEKVCGIQAKIKYVNDILIEGYKICGILTESAVCGDDISYICVGIGINIKKSVYPEDIPYGVASLENFTNQPISFEMLASFTLNKLEEYVENYDIENIKIEYESLLVDRLF